MDTPSTFYQYGIFLGNLQNAYVNAFKQIAAGMQLAGKGMKLSLVPDSQLTPEQLEIRRQRRLEIKIESERTAGLRHVRHLVAEERRFWGLDEGKRIR